MTVHLPEEFVQQAQAWSDEQLSQMRLDVVQLILSEYPEEEILSAIVRQGWPETFARWYLAALRSNDNYIVLAVPGRKHFEADTEDLRHVDPVQTDNRRARWNVERASRAGRIATWFLGASSILALVEIGGSVREAKLLQMVFSGDPPAMSIISASDEFQRIVGLTSVGLYILTVIAFLIWLYRTVSAAYDLRARSFPHTPGWSVGSFFIPFINLYRPVVVVHDLYKASDPRNLDDDWRRGEADLIIVPWWLCWIAAGFAGQMVFRAAIEEPTIDSLKHLNTISIVSEVLMFVSALFAIGVVRSLSARQAAKLARLFVSNGPLPSEAPSEVSGIQSSSEMEAAQDLAESSRLSPYVAEPGEGDVPGIDTTAEPQQELPTPPEALEFSTAQDPPGVLGQSDAITALERLAALYREGLLTKEEFEAQKGAVLRSHSKP